MENLSSLKMKLDGERAKELKRSNAVRLSGLPSDLIKAGKVVSADEYCSMLAWRFISAIYRSQRFKASTCFNSWPCQLKCLFHVLKMSSWISQNLHRTEKFPLQLALATYNVSTLHKFYNSTLRCDVTIFCINLSPEFPRWDENSPRFELLRVLFWHEHIVDFYFCFVRRRLSSDVKKSEGKYQTWKVLLLERLKNDPFKIARSADYLDSLIHKTVEISYDLLPDYSLSQIKCNHPNILFHNSM